MRCRWSQCMTSSGLVVIVAICATSAFPLSASHEDEFSSVGAMRKFLGQPTSVHSYRGTRRLEASGSGQRGWLDARTDFTPDAGFDYEVIAEGGSGYIRFHVLRALLEEERRLIAQGASSEVALS